RLCGSRIDNASFTRSRRSARVSNTRTRPTAALKMSILRRMNQFPDGVPKNVERDRLIQDDVDCCRFRVLGFDLSAEAGEQDDWNVLVHLLDEARSLLAVHFRHGAVHDHEIEMAKPKFLERFAST